MAKTDPRQNSVLKEVMRHYQWASDETDRRRTGRGNIGTISFDEADELFRSWLDENRWPYDALLFDPRVFTFIIEKTSRLISNKVKGKLHPREGSDVLGAHVNNELLSFQWDNATHDGTMLAKWSLLDINARKYGASFALCKWRYEVDSKGKTVFDGPDMRVLNNRDCLPDPTATTIESANWFQVRDYVTIQELERVNDMAREEPIYDNLKILKVSIAADEESTAGGDDQSSNWISRNRAISRLDTQAAQRDTVFKRVEIVTEYRKDRWITFSPRHGVLLRDIPNPHPNYEVPITMVKYYQVDDDLYGLSEIEPVKGLQKAINALLSQYVDEINQKLYSPIAVGPGVRQKTLEWGKGAQWLMNSPTTDFKLVESQSNAAQFFQSTYSALVSAMMNALGESSLGVSNIGDFQKEKTATEVKQLTATTNARDTYNQIFLAEAIKRQMMLWLTMNQQMLFNDPDKKSYVIRIVGRDAVKFFKEKGLAGAKIDDESLMELAENPDINPSEFEEPIFPVDTKEGVVPKFRLDDDERTGELFIQPEDLKGNYDYIVDIKSMALVKNDEDKLGRNIAMQTMLTNPNVAQMLQGEQIKPKFKDLFVSWLEDNGLQDAEQYFESVQPPPQLPQEPERPKEPGQPEINQLQPSGANLSTRTPSFASQAANPSGDQNGFSPTTIKL